MTNGSVAALMSSVFPSCWSQSAVPNRHEVTIQHHGQVNWKAEYRDNANFLNSMAILEWQWWEDTSPSK